MIEKNQVAEICGTHSISLCKLKAGSKESWRRISVKYDSQGRLAVAVTSMFSHACAASINSSSRVVLSSTDLDHETILVTLECLIAEHARLLFL